MGCVGKITKFIDNKGQELNHDPQPLHWKRIRWEGYDPFQAIPLKPNETELLDILVQKESDPSKVFLFTPPLYEPNPMAQLMRLPCGTQSIEVAIYSDNFGFCIEQFDVDWKDDMHSYKSLILRPSIPDKEGYRKL